MAELNEASNVHDAPPPYASEDHLTGKRFDIKSNEKRIWPQTPSNTQSSPSGSSPRGKGRPPRDLDYSLMRTLIRLFVYTSVSVQRMTTAVEDSGGPGRQWVINKLNKYTGAGPKANVSLSKLRIQDKAQTGRAIEKNQIVGQAPLPCQCDHCELAGQESGTEMLPESKDTTIRDSGSADDNIYQHITTPSPINSELAQGPHSTSQTAGSPRKRRIMLRPRPTDIIKKLDGRKGGPNHHIGRCCTIRNPTIASRSSSMSSICYTKKERTEFRHYVNFDNREQTEALETNPGILPPPTEVQCHGKPRVLELILRNPAEEEKDENVAIRLNDFFSGKDKASLKLLVNEADEHGITPLHIATALGLQKTCGILMAHKADTKARTQEKTCINHFAKQAERIAGETDLGLFFRILQCRQCVKRDIQPLKPTRKRRLSEQSPTSPRNAGSGEAKVPRTVQPQLSASTPCPDPRMNSTPLAEVGGEVDGTRNARYIFTTVFTDSPAASVHTNPSVIDLRHQPNWNNIQRTVANRDSRSPASPLGRDVMNASDETAPFDARSMGNIGDQSRLASLNQVSQSFSDMEQYGFTGTALPLPLEDILQNSEAVDSYDFGYQPVSPAPATSIDSSFPWHPYAPPADVEEHSTEDPVLYQGHPQQFTSQQDSQHALGFQPLSNFSQGSFPNAFSQTANENPDLSTNLAGGEVYWLCPHEMPRNFRATFCRYGCPRLET